MPGIFDIPGAKQPKRVVKPAQTVTEAKPQAKIVPFTACDECGYSSDGGAISRALFKVGLPGGILWFCGSHFRTHALAFIAHKYVITDLTAN